MPAPPDLAVTWENISRSGPESTHKRPRAHRIGAHKGRASLRLLHCNDAGRGRSPTDPTQVASEHYSVMKEPSVIVWFPLASIANTSNKYTVFGSRNSGGTVTLVAEAGRVT